MAVSLEIIQKDRTSHARLGTVTTPHGTFQTPAFMTVGTKAALKGVTAEQARDAGAEVLLANTYHLLLRPGSELIERRGGLHPFMCWDGPILTDSGGYQAYSMADINAIDEDGVTFKSIITGESIHLSPEIATKTQNELGADIIMAFDDCPPSVDPRTVNQARLRITAQSKRENKEGYDHGRRLDEALDRTARWLERCKQAHQREETQALFGIVQGGTDLERRTKSVEQVCNVELPGYAIGGVAVGEGTDDIARVVRHTAPLLPEQKPRYLMGVGYERDIVTAVRAGVDMFDCVLPTRNGRNANAFTANGQIRLRNAKYAEDDRPIDPSDPDPLPYSRAYLRHLFMSKEMLGPILVSLHNVRHFQRLMVDIRRAIRDDDWPAFAERWPVAAEAIGLPSASGPIV
ncbi:MAG: tRNA guanosine(34) transglycosylase Tgt [Planctomycetota bacterium]